MVLNEFLALFYTSMLELMFLVFRTSYTSVLTIVAFSMERYLAICHPLHSYAMSGLRRAVRIIKLVWFVSFLCALPFAAFTKVSTEVIL